MSFLYSEEACFVCGTKAKEEVMNVHGHIISSELWSMFNVLLAHSKIKMFIYMYWAMQTRRQHYTGAWTTSCLMFALLIQIANTEVCASNQGKCSTTRVPHHFLHCECGLRWYQHTYTPSRGPQIQLTVCSTDG